MRGIIFSGALLLAASFVSLNPWAASRAAGAEASRGIPATALAQADTSEKAPPAEKPDSNKPDSNAKAPEKAAAASKEGYRLQDLDDPTLPLEPVKPRTRAEQERVDAISWYMAGKALEGKSDFQGAMRAYKKAIEHDPNAVAIYRALIPLAFSLNQTEEAVKWALKAVELDPSDYQLLRRLGVHQASQGDNAGAVKLLEQAAKAPDLKKESALYVSLMRDLAVLYLALGRAAEASDHFEVVFDALTNQEKYQLDFRTRAQLLEGDAAKTFERMGQAFLDNKRTELAIKAFEKAADSKKGAAGNLSFNLSRVYLQSDQAEKALAELQKYFDAQRTSKGRAAYELLSEILQKLGKQAELITRLEEMLERDSRNSTLQYFLADQYLAAKRLEDAEKLYKKTLKSTPESQGYVGLAAVYRQMSRPSDLLEALSKAFSEANDLKGLQAEIKAVAGDEKLLAGLLDAGRKLSQEDPSKLEFAAAYLLANIAAEAKQTVAVEEFYRLALKLRREAPAQALVFEELGQHFVDVKQFANAAKVWDEAAHDPLLIDTKPHFLYLLTQARELAGNTAGAIEAIGQARQIFPDNPLLQYQEAWVYAHSQQYDEAIKRFEKLISMPPQSKRIQRMAQFNLSNIHVQQGNIRKGEEILEAVLAEAPDDPSVNNDLGYLYADQGKNLDQAEKMIRKAIAAEPENAAYLDSMGWILFKQGKFQEALPYLEKAVKNSTGSDEAVWDHLGDVYQRLEQTPKALDAWKKSLEIARAGARPDAKLMGRVEEKIKTQQAGAGKLKPERNGSP